jgi:hypothetical protein
MKRRLPHVPRLAKHTVLALLVAAALVSVGAGGQKPPKGPAKSLKLDHFWCYIVSSQTPDAAVTVTLEDQFQTTTVLVGDPLQFCNPVQKTVGEVVTPIVDLTDHLTMYNLLTAAPLPTARTLTATNQFGATRFTVDKATTLMVPTQKNTLAFPTGLDHYLCYPVSGPSVEQAASLTDQFQTRNVIVAKPALFCNPVEKTFGNTRTRIQNRAAHLVCYNTRLPQSTDARDVDILDQFEKDTFTVTTTQLLCAPSTKTLVS